jgi:hypothetical protein
MRLLCEYGNQVCDCSQWTTKDIESSTHCTHLPIAVQSNGKGLKRCDQIGPQPGYCLGLALSMVKVSNTL